MKKKAPKRRSHKKRDHLRSDFPLIEETKFNRFTDFFTDAYQKENEIRGFMDLWKIRYKSLILLRYNKSYEIIHTS